MIPYWFMFSLPLVAVFSPVKTARDLKLFALLSFAVLGLFMIGTRHEVGGDWFSYLNEYNLVQESISLTEALKVTDPGYALFNWIMVQLDVGIYGVNLICGAIFMAGLVAFSRRMPLPWLAILVAIPYLFTVVAMGYTRQAVALGFEFFALSALARHASVKFFLLVLCAALFHKTAVMLALFGIFSGPNRFSPLRIISGIAVVGITFAMFLQASYESLLLNYVTHTMHSSGGLIRVIMNAVPAVVLLLLYKPWMRRFGKQEPWVAFALLSLLCVPLVAVASTAVDRMALYLLPIQLYVWSHFPLFLKNPMYRYAALLMITGVYVAVMWVWLAYGVHAKYWLPYQSVLFL